MRVAAILGLGCTSRDLKPFQLNKDVEWQLGVPATGDVDVVLVFGGDGTVHRHLGQLVLVGAPVLVVPAGSGNDFARALGLARVRDSVAAWSKFCAGGANVRAIDLGVITAGASSVGDDATSRGGEIPTSPKIREKWGTPLPTSSLESPRYFCCVAGVGLDSEVARRANSLPRWLRGHGGYALSFAPCIFSFAPVPVRISITDRDGWTVRNDAPTLLAAFANTPMYGGGMKIAPRAQMDDGLLDVCVVGGVSKVKLASVFPTVYRGKHLSIKEVSYFSAERVRVETEHPLDVYADGEFVCRTPVEIGVKAKAMRVVVS
jgi:diacylglycerol kinase (ATP)